MSVPVVVCRARLWRYGFGETSSASTVSNNDAPDDGDSHRTLSPASLPPPLVTPSLDASYGNVSANDRTVTFPPVNTPK